MKDRSTLFGKFAVPAEYRQDELALSVSEQAGRTHYQRGLAGDSVEKFLHDSSFELVVHPIEPVQIPNRVATHLLLHLETAHVIGPKSEDTIYLTFPVEIAVIAVKKNKSHKTIDVFSLSQSKLTLYGSPRDGKLCKYWSSGTFTAVPPVDPLREGVLELTVKNGSTEWIELNQVVLNAFGIKIYYNNELVSMRGKMDIFSHHLAETDIVDSPLKKGMKKAHEVYQPKLLNIVSTKFTMEAGL